MRICVYGASSDSLKREFYEQAYAFGALLARGGHSLVYGGGSGGLMGACARGAGDQGGRVIGIAPRFFDEPGVLQQGCTRFIYTDTLRQRKQLMEEMSDGFAALPGGVGTFDEFFEILTLRQLGRHSKPLGLLNTLGYYDAMLAMLRKGVEGGFIGAAVPGLICPAGSPEELLSYLLSHRETGESEKNLSDYWR